MKKYLYKIVCATLILISTSVVKASNEVYYINENNIEMTEKQYNNLLSLQFTEQDIKTMSQEEFNNNKDLEGELLNEATKYIKTTTYMRNGIKQYVREEITKEEAMKEKELHSQGSFSKGPSGSYYDGIAYSSVLEITSKIIGLNNTYMRYHTKTEWVTMPSDRYYDIIGIGIESSKVYIASAVIFRENWITTSNTSGHLETCYPKSTSTGGLAIFELPTASLTDLNAVIYFNVSKKSGVGTITSLYAAGDYAHGICSGVNPSTLLNSVSINYPSGLMVSSPYSSCYLGQSPAIASFVGTW